jgi:hypothetical protein
MAASDRKRSLDGLLPAAMGLDTSERVRELFLLMVALTGGTLELVGSPIQREALLTTYRRRLRRDRSGIDGLADLVDALEQSGSNDVLAWFGVDGDQHLTVITELDESAALGVVRVQSGGTDDRA